MENEVKFPQTVMLLDAVTIGDIIRDFKKHFEQLLKRPIQNMDLPQFIINLVLDSTAQNEEGETQVILIYDHSITKIEGCSPSDLKKELHDVAFKDETFGEFIFASLSPEEMTLRDDFFFDLLRTVGESTDVKRIILAPSHEIDRPTLWSITDKIENKDITLFSLLEPEERSNCTWKTLGFPIIQALGISGEEL